MAKTYQIIMNYPAHTTYDGVPVEEKIVEKEKIRIFAQEIRKRRHKSEVSYVM